MFGARRRKPKPALRDAQPGRSASPIGTSFGSVDDPEEAEREQDDVDCVRPGEADARHQYPGERGADGQLEAEPDAAEGACGGHQLGGDQPGKGGESGRSLDGAGDRDHGREQVQRPDRRMGLGGVEPRDAGEHRDADPADDGADDEHEPAVERIQQHPAPDARR